MKPSPAIETAGLKLGHHGGIVVGRFCAVPGSFGIWAAGDCAEVPKSGHESIYAPTAQNATREGKQVARNIASTIHGRTPQSFVYTPIGELAIVGKRSGVASLHRVQFSGTLAWAMWRAIYLAKLPSLSMRVRVGFDWLLNAMFSPEITALPERVSHSGNDANHNNAGTNGDDWPED